jgi:hypothetical protein
MKAWIAIVLAACGSKAAPVSAPPSGVASVPAVPAQREPSADDACRKLSPDRGNAVLGELPRAAMPFAATADDGKRVDLAQLRGRVVMMAFESSIIGVSTPEQQTLDGLATAIGGDLAIVRIASDETAADAAQGVTKSYANIFDRSQGRCSMIGTLTHDWGVDLLPETVLIDRAGNLRYHFAGPIDWSMPKAIACIHALTRDTLPAITAPPSNAAAPEPPCVDQQADPKHVISGTITFPDKTKLVKGTAIFISAKSVAGGHILAVDKLRYDGRDLAFELDDTKTLVSGIVLTGNVIVTALYDHDGDVMTHEPGDRKGLVKVAVPATHVTIVVDSAR